MRNIIINIDTQELVGCDISPAGKAYCNHCFWSNKEFGRKLCIGRTEYRKLLEHRAKAFFKTCSRCGEVFGCKVEGQNYYKERWCDTCLHETDCDRTGMLKSNDTMCIKCSNLADEEYNEDCS